MVNNELDYYMDLKQRKPEVFVQAATRARADIRQVMFDECIAKRTKGIRPPGGNPPQVTTRQPQGPRSETAAGNAVAGRVGPGTEDQKSIDGKFPDDEDADFVDPLLPPGYVPRYFPDPADSVG